MKEGKKAKEAGKEQNSNGPVNFADFEGQFNKLN